MDISDPLAALNAARYQAWTRKFTERNARQAVLAFDGDVADGLRARELIRRPGVAQQHHPQRPVGVLRPMDWMQPYRLEMGTQLGGRGRPTCTATGAAGSPST